MRAAGLEPKDAESAGNFCTWYLLWKDGVEKARRLQLNVESPLFLFASFCLAFEAYACQLGLKPNKTAAKYGSMGNNILVFFRPVSLE